MQAIRNARLDASISQRILAVKAGISFGALQRLEWGKHDPRCSTIDRVAAALGFGKRSLERVLARHLAGGADSVSEASLRLLEDGEAAWPLGLFNFVDAFRKEPQARLIALPPAVECSPRIQALFASTVEALCLERNMPAPAWCRGIPALAGPWFPADIENLKASALAESPVHFRKRGIFVLGNFLERA